MESTLAIGKTESEHTTENLRTEITAQYRPVPDQALLTSQSMPLGFLTVVIEVKSDQNGLG